MARPAAKRAGHDRCAGGAVDRESMTRMRVDALDDLKLLTGRVYDVERDAIVALGAE
jgi:hypothetical protein